MSLGRDAMRQLATLLRPLSNRVSNMVARAVVELVDDSRKRQIVQAGVLDGETIDDAEHFQPYGFKSVPRPGAEAVIVFPNGDRAHALILAVDDRRYRPTDWEPGEAGLYNDAQAVVRLRDDGTIEAGPVGGPFEPLVLRSEFLGHGHATAATGAVSPPIVAPAPGSAVTFPGTSKLRGG